MSCEATVARLWFVCGVSVDERVSAAALSLREDWAFRTLCMHHRVTPVRFLTRDRPWVETRNFSGARLWL